MAASRRVRAARFHCAAHTVAQFPRATVPEFAFAGRSNVGKSALLNALLGRKGLAKVSGTPGKTQSVNFFDIDDCCRWVDLPGYGYAKVSKRLQAHWGRVIAQYLETRAVLQCVVCLSDSRRPPTDLDVQLTQWLDSCGVSWVGVLTKADKLKQSERARAEGAARAAYGCGPDHPILLCSATTRRGLEGVWPFVLPLATAGGN